MKDMKAGGNRVKHAAYSSAFKQIKRALSDGYFLEAITIAESIISDRLQSVLLGKKLLCPSDVLDNVGFKRLISRLDSVSKSEFDGQYCNLRQRLQTFRCSRNFLIHASVRSFPGTPPIPPEIFRLAARGCAQEAEDLAQLACSWQKRGHRKALKNAEVQHHS